MNKNIFLLFVFSFNFISSVNSMISGFFKNIFLKNKILNNQNNELYNKFSKERLPERVLIIENKNALTKEENYPAFKNIETNKFYYGNRVFNIIGKNIESCIIYEKESKNKNVLVNNLKDINVYNNQSFIFDPKNKFYNIYKKKEKIEKIKETKKLLVNTFMKNYYYGYSNEKKVKNNNNEYSNKEAVLEIIKDHREKQHEANRKMVQDCLFFLQCDFKKK